MSRRSARTGAATKRPDLQSSSELPRFEQVLLDVRANNPALDRIVRSDFYNAVDIGPRLGEALLQNAVVSSILVQIDDLISSSTMLSSYKRDQSSRTGTAATEVVTSTAIENDVRLSLDPLLRYLQSSATLRDVVVEGGSNGSPRELYETAWCLTLQAIGQNPHGRLYLKLYSRAPHRPAAQFLRETTSLRHFTFAAFPSRHENTTAAADIDDTMEPTNGPYAQLAAGFAANASLQTLVLSFPGDASIDVGGAILVAIAHSQASQLQSIELDFLHARRSIPDDLTTFLRSPASAGCAHLRRVKLNGLFMQQESAEALAAALLVGRVPEVTLKDCPLDEACSRSFYQIMQASSNSSSSSSATTATAESASATNLCIHRTRDYSPDMLTFPPQAMGLFSISVTSPVRVHTLRMRVLRQVQLQAIAFYLPKATFMCHLELTLQRPNVHTTLEQSQGIPLEFLNAHGPLLYEKLVDGLRRNGSLQEFTANERGQSIFPEPLNRRRQAYLERNRQLPKLLSKKRTREDDDEAEATTRAGDTKLYPSLLVASVAADAMAPKHVMMGLRSMTVSDPSSQPPSSSSSSIQRDSDDKLPAKRSRR